MEDLSVIEPFMCFYYGFGRMNESKPPRFALSALTFSETFLG